MIRLGLQAESGFWHDLIVEHGPARILRRLQTLLAIVLAPWMLKKIGWRGSNDLGWNSDQSRSDRFGDFLLYFAIGTLLMASLFITAMYTNVREWQSISFGGLLSAIISGVLITGLGVGFIEETLTRGVLYRCMARAWTAWAGALVSSGLFAWAHFMKASPESFESGILPILRSSLFENFSDSVTPLKFLNLFVFGLVLCRLVHHRGDIWGAVGLHAAAVGSIKVFSKLTDYNRNIAYRAWLGGHSSKFNDGWLMTLLLIVLLLALEYLHRSGRSSPRVHI